MVTRGSRTALKRVCTLRSVGSLLLAVVVLASGCTLVIDTDSLGEGCPAEQKDCNGVCVSRADPEYGCGNDSCQPCVLPHGQSVCDARQRCAIAACVDNFQDCDGKAETGCEVNLDTDVEHCGACDADPCEVSGAYPACARGVCAIRKCMPGFKDCNRRSEDGCETNVLTHDDHCGACDTGCLPPASCLDGGCQ